MWTVQAEYREHDAQRGMVILIATFVEGDFRFVYRGRCKLNGADQQRYVQAAEREKDKAYQQKVEGAARASVVELELNSGN